MLIRAVDPADAAAVAAWHATYHAADVHGRPFATPFVLEEVRAELAGRRAGDRTLAYAGVVDDEVACAGQLHLYLKDNLHLADVAVHTLPGRRGRGHGAAMLDHLAGVAREQGRRTLVAQASFPYDAPADGHGHPSVDFLLHRGFTFVLGDVMRVLDLPADTELLERLVADAAPHHEGYTLRHFRGPVPDDILPAFGRLIGTLVTEAPSGELEVEQEAFDEERIRSDEAVFAASGRTKHTTVAIAPDGDVVAYSELVVPAHDPGHVYQWGTLVLPEHRGHRLGTATKAANLLRLQREHTGAGLLVTFNAEVNRHMIAVNEAMGFRPVERLGEYQLRL